MRIAELSTRYPPGPGGVERHVQEIARRLQARGDSVRVLTSELNREFPWEKLGPEIPRRTTEPGGLSIRRLPVFTLPGELHYPFFRGLDRALEEEAPDLVHVHTYGTHHASVARRFHRRGGAPYVLTAHFHPIWSIHGGYLRHRLRAFYDRRLAGGVLRDAARLIVQTREEERLMRALGLPLPPTEIIPPGYTPLPEPEGPPDAFARSLGLPGPYLLFVGRLASNKGLLELVEAFAPLARREREVSLVLVGADGGMQEAVLARIRALGLAGRVRLTGFLADDRILAGAFRGARIALLPSEYEAFGLVLLEALAQGTPVIASRVGGIPEVLDGGAAGRLVPPKSVAPLAEAIEGMYADPEGARRLAEYGRSRVVPRYSWEALADRLHALFREVVGP